MSDHKISTEIPLSTYSPQVEKVLRKLSTARDTDKIARLQTEAQNTQLKSEITNYLRQISDLKINLEKLKCENLQLKHGQSNLKLENDTLNERFKILALENEDLKVNIARSFKNEEDSFKSNKEIYSTENNILTQKHSILQKKLKKSEQDFSQSVKEANSWNEKYLESSKREIKLVKDLSIFKAENEILKNEVKSLSEWQEKVKKKCISMKSIEVKNESLRKQNRLLIELNERSNRECDSLVWGGAQKTKNKKITKKFLDPGRVDPARFPS